MSANHKDTPQKQDANPPEKAEIIACPMDLWADIVRALGDQKYKKVGGLLQKMMSIQPQVVEVTRQP